MKIKKLASKEEWSYSELSKFLFHCKYQRKVFLAEGQTRLKIPEWGASWNIWETIKRADVAGTEIEGTRSGQ